MKSKILLMVCALSFFVFGCTKKKTDNAAEIVTVTEDCGVVNDTAFLDSAFLFIPETKSDVLIHGIDRVIEDGNRFLILDVQMKRVFCFDKSGKHQFTIHAVGSGPGEYVNLFDIAIDRKEERLLLLTYPPAIHYYTLDGTYERTLPLDGMCKSLAVTDEYIYLRKETYANNQLSDYSLLTIEKKTGQRHSLWKPLSETAPFCMSGNMQMTGESPVYLTRKFDDTIYTMRGDRVEKAYTIDWGDRAFPVSEEKRTYGCAELNKMCMKEKYVYTMTDLCDTPNYLLFRTNQPGLYVLSKEKKEVSNYRIIMNTDYQLAMPNFIPVEGNRKRVFFVYPPDILKMQGRSGKEHLNANLIRLLEQVSEDDNPVVFSYVVK
ncbi:6-bladed beta-propeller [Bacteroides helcogenes]|uniref:Lipoprotein n=1 Tax=Bacteroides helcogenes (strain ATCC 35417 / DSM 20613 / JCM 6297 / CCUG 15421 / P 36-108) TaxID=693979 RepID=E6SWI7_BACT6|nr:6-bladed beta-propeller [Bacteroides helcogenes]ADV42585.1 putative lipoprotein [Bacteroides helcogenes P 36-108]MDY5237654.1 6-bladed beta-propeller [Bacteroides helcogenes]